ncbi:DUF2760 domain-containing protein [Hahella sp. NBU794]|uniref:DUF2760 domain-containing protein n=1 Tax=Hahella sp. NBU794 TaxID=3422590 RepID=UPI003D6FCE09
MNLNLTAMPTTIDLLHLGLAVFAIVFLAAWLSARKNAKSQSVASQPAPQPVEKTAEPAPEVKPEPVNPFKDSTPDSALQLLALLQQNARFIDFLKEDLAGFSDADIGAAARVVHEGGQKTLNEYFTLAPLRQEEEETRVTLPEGFNASEVRLTGNVAGQAPFTGVLVHRGWKAVDVKLPKLAKEHDAAIIAPAEVEL